MKWQPDEEMILTEYVLEKGTYEGFIAAALLLDRPMSSIRAKWYRDGDKLTETYINRYSINEPKSTKESLWKKILRKLLRKNC